MWQISATRWLNPLAIASVYDYTDQDFVMVMYIGGTLTDGANQERFAGAERQILLAFLAQHSQHVFLAHDDKPPF